MSWNSGTLSKEGYSRSKIASEVGCSQRSVSGMLELGFRAKIKGMNCWRPSTLHGESSHLMT